jgi:hypothetical protein
MIDPKPPAGALFGGQYNRSSSMNRHIHVAAMMILALAMGAAGASGAAKYSTPAEVLAV